MLFHGCKCNYILCTKSLRIQTNWYQSLLSQLISIQSKLINKDTISTCTYYYEFRDCMAKKLLIWRKTLLRKFIKLTISYN